MKLLPLYAALLALIYVVLSFRTILLRTKLKIGIGDDDNIEMRRMMRVHANFAEYVPLALLLIYLTEMKGASFYFIHFVAICLIVGRLLHAYGVSQVKETLIFRQAGMILTFTSLVVCAVRLLTDYV